MREGGVCYLLVCLQELEYRSRSTLSEPCSRRVDWSPRAHRLSAVKPSHLETQLPASRLPLITWHLLTTEPSFLIGLKGKLSLTADSKLKHVYVYVIQQLTVLETETRLYFTTRIALVVTSLPLQSDITHTLGCFKFFCLLHFSRDGNDVLIYFYITLHKSI